jgi:prefoldin beta subunit
METSLIEKEYKALQKMQTDYNTNVSTLTKLESQHRENEMVLEELKLVSVTEKIYKQIGSILFTQDKDEAVVNVKKRLEFISTDMKRVEKLLTDLKSKMESKRMELMALQQSKQVQ